MLGSKAPRAGGFGGFATSTTTLSYLSPPPDFSSIPQDVVVPFKNLLKKASPTREKALQDIFAYLQSRPSDAQELDDAIIGAYIQLYPRLSIDDSARARELAHQVLFQLLNTAKKRLGKRLSDFVGPWLAGTFDRDKKVSRAATEALSSLIQTKEKEEAFYKAVKNRALEFAIEAIRETPDTLSDERSTTKEDSDAKYFRVVGASLSLVLHLLRRRYFSALDDKLAEYLQVDALWSLSKSEDPFVRRAFYQLLCAVLETNPEAIEPRLQQIGRALIADGLKSSQAASATDFLTALTALTSRFPQVWGTQKHPLQRLQPFVAQGSQGGSDEFWRALDQLLTALPDKPPPLEVVSSFLGSMRKGIVNRLETIRGRHEAIQPYARVFELFLIQQPPTAGFLEENLSSLTQQYFHPKPESGLPSPQQPDFLVEAWISVTSHPVTESRQAAAEEWKRLASLFVSRMANSLPEVSEGYRRSQNAVASEGERWFSMAQRILSHEADKSASLKSLVNQSSSSVIHEALDLLSRRNFKPFGAASVIQSAFRHCPRLCADQDMLGKLFPADQTEIYRTVAASPSLPYLVSDLDAASLGNRPRFESIWTALARSAVQIEDRSSAIAATRLLIGVPSATELAQQDGSLQGFLVSVWKEYTSRPSSAVRDLCEGSLSCDSLTKESMNTVVADLIHDLNVPEMSQSALAGLELILTKRPELLPTDPNLHVLLVTNLLALTQLSEPGLSDKAKAVRILLDQQPTTQNSITRILEQNLNSASSSSLEIDTLVQQGLENLRSGATPTEEVFPSSTVWLAELARFLSRAPNPSLSLTSSMGGSLFLVGGGLDTKISSARDRSGRSAPARMAMFTAQLLGSGVELSSLPPEFQLELVYLLCVTQSLAEDELASASPDGLWEGGPEMEADFQQFSDLSMVVINAVVEDAKGWIDSDMSGDSLVERLINFMLQEACGRTPHAFYSAKALCSLFQSLVRVHGPPSKLEEWVTRLGVMRMSPDTIFATAAFLAGFGDTLVSSKAVATLCTRLMSEIPGYSPSQPRTLPSLVLLNLCMAVYEDTQVPVETRKQVLALQRMTSWTETPEEMDYRVAAETCKAITRLVPGTKDTYGPYWEQAIEYCIWLWSNASKDEVRKRLSYVHASLKLMQALRAAEDANDDLVEALENHARAESAGLLALLGMPRDATASLPSELVDALLARAVSKIPQAHLLAKLDDIYESVASESREIQKAAFDVLHRTLPVLQDDINVTVITDKKPANLPDELLSLLLNAPNPEDYTDEDLSQFPVTIRSYLLAWHLVFDAYSTASLRVRNDYTENLRSGKHLDPLLRFLVDVLGHALARALDLDKEGFTADHIRSYSIDLADSEPAERDMNWLLIHLFYLILKYIPGLFKLWYLDCRSKQTTNTIQSWMQKFFSPLIISDALDEVVKWSSTQEGADGDEQEVIVKVNKAAREVSAGYPVDDDAATISLRVPTSYPLDPVDVVGVKRVAVREEKWQSWLKATKAVMMFGNCSIVDGLVAFRRSISLALRGQEECAICYSIIAQDKSLPDKKCGTCSHAFHRVCLYKWFQNSGRNTCPLCRNAIDYLGSDTKRRRPEHE
ncbi:hypothetical protein VTK26DRAFT_9328 [Humicola hyalothermophila]